VRGGKATVTTESVIREGHCSLAGRDPKDCKSVIGEDQVMISARRSAIGYSRDKTKLYYVVANILSLPDFAKVLASDKVGVYEAMALDGGNGPALAYNGSVKEPPGASQPYFILAKQTTSETKTRQGCKEEK